MEAVLIGHEIPLFNFYLHLGASLSEDRTSITFCGNERGFVVYGPYFPVKAGIYTFVVNVLFPSNEMPRAFVDIYGDGIVFASQRISSHCTTVRIRATIRIDCRLEVRLYSEWTPFELKRVTFTLEPGAPSMYPSAREQLRVKITQLLNADTTIVAPQSGATLSSS